MSNLFDPEGDDEKNDPHFFTDLHEDVTEELGKHGRVAMLNVLKNSAGQVLVELEDELGAGKVVGALNGRWFAGKQIAAVTIDQQTYEERRTAG